MKRRLLELLGVFFVVTTVFVVLLLTAIPSEGQTEDTNEWGRPNLEGIWLDVYATPFERAPELGDREFTTPEERAARHQALSSSAGRDRRGPPPPPSSSRAEALDWMGANAAHQNDDQLQQALAALPIRHTGKIGHICRGRY